MLFLLYAANLLCFSKTIVKLIEDIRDINKLKRIRKEIELSENLKQNQRNFICICFIMVLYHSEIIITSKG